MDDLAYSTEETNGNGSHFGHIEGIGFPSVIQTSKPIASPKKTRIFWTREEWDDVTERAAELIVFDGYSELEALNQAAQEAVPEHRRRHFNTSSKATVPEFAARIPKALEAQRRAAAGQQQEQEPAAKPAVVLPNESSAGLLARAFGQILLEALESPRGQAAIMGAFDTWQLKQEGLQAPAAPKPCATVTAGFGPRPRTVLVVGLLGVQIEQVKHEFANIFKLKFMSKTDGIDAIRSAAKSADHVFGMVSFCGGEVDRAVAKCTKEYTRVNGTMTDLRTQLAKYFSEKVFSAAAGGD
jgi:hypothetical protein